MTENILREVIDRYEKYWRVMLFDSDNLEEGADMFGDEILVLIDDLIEECKLALSDLDIMDNKIEREIKIKMIPPKKKETLQKQNKMILTEIYRGKIVDKLRILEQIKMKRTPRKKTRRKGITKDLIDKVKLVPIENEIEFDGGNKALSLWAPQERTPSMHYYKNDNRVHCFASGEGGSVIDVVMLKHNLDFNGAVKYLQETYAVT